METATTKAITLDGGLRAAFVRVIMDEWDKNMPTQNSSMAIQAANAVMALLLHQR
jgi:hypothetical protein